jgi:hypothetical protein
MVVQGLLAQEGVLTRREDSLSVREEKARIFEKALIHVSTTLGVERTKAKATQ